MDALRRCKDDPWKVYEEETPRCSTRHQEHGGCLQDTLQLDHLQLLRESFARQRPLVPRPGGRAGRPSASSMSLEEFRTTLSAVIGSDRWTSETEELFNEVDTSSDGHVGWEELCTYMLQLYRQKDDSSQASRALLCPQPLIRRCLHNKQEPITRVVAVSQPPPLRYVSISKGGTLTIWNSHLHILKSLELAEDPSEERGTHRRFSVWTTDAVYMPNVHKIAVATMSRDIRFFDVSTSNCFEEFHLFGLSHVATSFCYWYDSKSPGDRSVLMWGDEKGAVNLLWFLHPHKGLFETPFKNGQNGPQRVFMQGISDHGLLVSYQQVPGIHNETINRIMCYEPHADLIITSSESASSSVVMMDVDLRRKSYIWKINKGVTCFDFCPSMSLLVTAGLDPGVRLWNRYVTACPVAILRGHCTTVLDVVIHQPLGKIFSYSKDAVLKIWDIPSQLCVRTLLLKFPCIQAGRTSEHGSFPLLLTLTPAPALLVTCRDYLGLLRLQNRDPEEQPAAFSCALYNPHLKQVVTACIDSSLAVWDVETGMKRVELRNAHGQEEITCMALDSTQRRLITGASNGTIKIWNLLNGHNLHKLEAISNTAVTGVICLQDNHLLAVGWSQQIAQYNIMDPNDMYVRADVSWKSGRQHSDDILALDHCPSLGLLATGSFDGEIIVWTLDSQRPVARLRRSPAAKVQPPVDRLLFLQRRAEERQWRSGPVLVSSEAGWVCWWSVSGPIHNHGQFYVPDRPDESVLGLSSDQDNGVLVTGDTTGSIQVWDISQYALWIGDGPVKGCPPLLHSWRGHEGALVSVEVLIFGARHFLVSASVDRTARVWTSDGGYVGSFGQEQPWDLSDPSCYQTSRELWSQHSGTTNKEEEEGVEKNDSDQSQQSTGTPDHTDWGQSSEGTERVNKCHREHNCHQQTVSPRDATAPGPEDIVHLPQAPMDIGPNCHIPPNSSALTQHTKVALGHLVVQDLQRQDRRQDRRQLFGDIDAQKLSRIRHVCTPFQALKMTEVRTPEDVPVRPRMLSGSLWCSRGTDLCSPLLSSTSSGNQTTQGMTWIVKGFDLEGSQPP